MLHHCKSEKTGVSIGIHIPYENTSSAFHSKHTHTRTRFSHRTQDYLQKRTLGFKHVVSFEEVPLSFQETSVLWTNAILLETNILLE